MNFSKLCQKKKIQIQGREYIVSQANLLVLLSENLLPAPVSKAVEELFFGADDPNRHADDPNRHWEKQQQKTEPSSQDKKKEFELFYKIIQLLLVSPDPVLIPIPHIKLLAMKLILNPYDENEAELAKK